MIETTARSNESDQDKFLEKILKVKHLYDVTRVSFIDGFSSTKLPVAIAYRPNSKVLAQSGGKGVSRTQALISALMESYECHSAEIAEHCFIEAYGGRDLNYANPFRISTTLKDYRETDPIRWSKAKSIFSEKEVFVPFAAVSLDFRNMSYIHKREPMMLTSNGLASGSCWDSACISAIYEIIERHSISTNEINNTDKKKLVRKETIYQRELIQLIELIEETGELSVELYDNTIWEEFPTYKSTISNGHMTWAGFGTHSNPIIAATRAITEANQARLISISGSREDMNKNFYLLSAGITGKKSKKKAIEMVEMRSNKNKSEMRLENVLNKVKEIAPNTYVYRYKQIDPSIYVVRVIAEGLHGYNYPGYRRMTILETTIQDAINVVEKESHSPAAG